MPGDRIEHAISVLASYGYERARPEPAPGYDARIGKAVALRHPGGVIVDLHRTLAAGTAGEGIDVHEIIARRRLVPLGPHTVRAPSWEAHLVECALHAVVGDGLARPLSLRDIAEVVHHPSLDAGAAAELALRWQVAELVGLGLRAARDGLGLELPDALAALAYRADVGVPASGPARSAQSRLDDLRSGDLRRRATLARSLVAPSSEFLQWAHGDASLPRLYGRRWPRSTSAPMEARQDQNPGAPELTAADVDTVTPAPLPRETGPPPSPDQAWVGATAPGPVPPTGRRARAADRPQPAGGLEPGPAGPPAPPPKGSGRSPDASGRCRRSCR